MYIGLLRKVYALQHSGILPYVKLVFLINRIIAMCGDYYIGGRRFASLSDLIGYYSHVSCLLKGEKLLFPVAPPEASTKTVIIKFLSVFYFIVGNFNHHSQFSLEKS